VRPEPCSPPEFSFLLLPLLLMESISRLGLLGILPVLLLAPAYVNEGNSTRSAPAKGMQRAGGVAVAALPY
jgi:hypothetical protein